MNREIAALGGIRPRSTSPLHPRHRWLRGPVLRRTGETEFRELGSRTILSRNSNPDLPFYWTINPYRGCEFGCRYCYARYTHEFFDRSVDEFERLIFVKREAGRVLRDTLRPGQLSGRTVAIGTATDPYQAAEVHFGITREVLETLAQAPDLILEITTKSPLILRDLDLLREISQTRPVRVHISLTTIDPNPGYSTSIPERYAVGTGRTDRESRR